MNRFGNWIAEWRDELVAGVASGLMLAASFPPFPTRFLSVFALVPVLWYFAVRPRAGLKRGFWLGFIQGVVFFAILMCWILRLIPESGVTMPWILGPALAILTAYLSCYTGLFGLAQGFLGKKLGPGAVFAAPAIWSLVEFIRSHGELGFSWGSLAYAFAIHPIAIQGASFYGPFGLTLMIVLLSALVAWALASKTWRARAAAGIAFAAIAGGHLIWGAGEIARVDRAKVRLNGEGGVAVMQPNVDLGLKFEASYRDSIFMQMQRYSEIASDRGANLIIFPETAAPVSFKFSPDYLGWMESMARGNSIDILTGYVDHTQKGAEFLAYNAAALISKQGGLAGNYHKVNLLPFGEKMPWSEYVPALSKIDFGQANFIPGKTQTIFDSSVGKFGVLICFESSFSDFTRRYIRGGADFLVNITNDGWFGDNQGPIQHAEMAIFRSVENRVTLFRAGYTGVSMVVDPAGRVQAYLGTFKEGMIYGTAYRSPRETVYTRHGYAIYFGMAIVNLILVWVVLLPKRHR